MRGHAFQVHSRARRWLPLAAVALVVAAVAVPFAMGRPAAAQIASVAPAAVQVSPPADSRLGHYESNTEIRAWQESASFALTSNLTVQFVAPGAYSALPGTNQTILAGTVVNSDFIHMDSVASQTVTLSGTVVFTTDIIGVIASAASLNASDYLGASGTLYANGSSVRGFEGGGGEHITIGSDH